MCGIAGIVATHALRPEDTGRVLRMRDVLAHRGPDGAGVFVDARAALGHRRLSIVDLAGGAQPLANEDETIQVVFNGEIYNHADLRPQLEAAGHRYHTRSDTETIVHAYEQWGDDCVQRFRGMFAFAIWDAPRRRLLLARDRLGVKPLYWARVGDRLLFASEIKAILESGLIEARANEAVLPEVLATRATAGEETLFRGIHKLMPGHVLTMADGHVQQRRYWDVPSAPEPASTAKGRADDAEAFRALLDESVRLRLMSDVPLGVFLSGGIDSSAIAGLMARRVGRLQTFSVAFEDRACNELEYAREVAASIGAENHEVIVGERDFFGALPRLIWHEDEPIAHPSSVPLLLRLRAGAPARQGGAHRRGQRRAARRLRPVSARAAQLAARRRLRVDRAGRDAARAWPGWPSACRARSAATPGDRSSPSSTRRTWRSSTTSPRSTWRGSASCCRRGCGIWCSASAPTDR